MAKKKEWVTPNSYDYKKNKVKWSEKKKNPEKYGLTKESVELKTVPGQSISVKELIERHEKGRPIPQE